jgi:hypothetical protein
LEGGIGKRSRMREAGAYTGYESLVVSHHLYLPPWFNVAKFL